MAERQDLCMKHGSIPEALPNRVEQREDDREHGIRKLSSLSFKFNWLNENRVFGRDRWCSFLAVDYPRPFDGLASATLMFGYLVLGASV